MNATYAPVVIVPVANPIQAECLERVFALTPPRNRLVVAAAYLSTRAHPVLVVDIFMAAGFTRSSFVHYTSESNRKRYPRVDGIVYMRLADALGVPVMALIGDAGQLLPDPTVVLDLPVSVRSMTGAWATPQDLAERMRRVRSGKRTSSAQVQAEDNVIALDARRRA